jgi:hypothetical protein
MVALRQYKISLRGCGARWGAIMRTNRGGSGVGRWELERAVGGACSEADVNRRRGLSILDAALNTTREVRLAGDSEYLPLGLELQEEPSAHRGLGQGVSQAIQVELPEFAGGEADFAVGALVLAV